MFLVFFQIHMSSMTGTFSIMVSALTIKLPLCKEDHANQIIISEIKTEQIVKSSVARLGNFLKPNPSKF